MSLGAFSVSLPVADLAASTTFYRALGFEPVAGDPDEHWLILRNGDAVIGLFEGMFDEPILTFNPGMDQQMQPVDPFVDVRDVQAHLWAAGIEPVTSTEAAGTEPAHIVVVDPDGNRIMVDQHRPRDGATSNDDPVEQ